MMIWMKRMEQVLDYIEAHLTGAIDFDEIAKLACCSNYNFQRVFSFCMELPLAEYIRNRRMSAAAEELRSSDIKILDLAVKYGYDSQEAFSRAFLKFHGVTPGQARHAPARLRSCPRATLMDRESSGPMNTRKASDMLEQCVSGERFRNLPPSPVTLNFPVSMWSYMEYTGENTNTMQTYTLIANLCGDTYGAGLALTEDEGIQSAAEQFGYKCEIFSTRPHDRNYLPEAELRERILNEITVNQRPVIAVNMIDCCFGGVIAGYEEHGECLLNWGYDPFDVSDSPQPVITACRDWYGKTQKVIFMEKKADVLPDLKEIYIHTLNKAAEYLGNAEALKTEDFFIWWINRLRENEPLIRNDYSIIDPMWCDYAEKRFYAGQFMLQLRAFLPQQEAKLNQLWDIFGNRVNRLMVEYIDKVELTPGADCGSINSMKLNDETIRQEMCEIIKQCEEEERKAAGLISDIVMNCEQAGYF